MKERDALAAVVELRGRVYTLAVYLLSDCEEAQDVTQEVLIRGWQHAQDVADDRLDAWVLRVTRNRCIDILRSRRRKSQWHRQYSRELAPSIADTRPSPEALASGNDLRRALGTALSALSEPYHSVVILREIQGLSYREISDILMMPVNTVRVTLHRARQKLRDMLREEYRHVAVG
jgi:RNA polymerase sigma-70 factor (ECF subfamily)